MWYENNYLYYTVCSLIMRKKEKKQSIKHTLGVEEKRLKPEKIWKNNLKLLLIYSFVTNTWWNGID